MRALRLWLWPVGALEGAIASSPLVRLHWTVFDGRGRATFLIDSVGAVVENVYDGERVANGDKYNSVG